MYCTCVLKVCSHVLVGNRVLNSLYFIQALLFISELLLCRYLDVHAVEYFARARVSVDGAVVVSLFMYDLLGYMMLCVV
jgi:hypothetical protein